jgi:hypothetical protein
MRASDFEVVREVRRVAHGQLNFFRKMWTAKRLKEGKMERQDAIELAEQAIRAKPQSYYAVPFTPHEWVIDAIMAAYQAGLDANKAVK